MGPAPAGPSSGAAGSSSHPVAPAGRGALTPATTFDPAARAAHAPAPSPSTGTAKQGLLLGWLTKPKTPAGDEGGGAS